MADDGYRATEIAVEGYAGIYWEIDPYRSFLRGIGCKLMDVGDHSYLLIIFLLFLCRIQLILISILSQLGFLVL